MIKFPNIGLFGEFEICEAGIIGAINKNFLILDALVQASFIDFVADDTELPLDPDEGDTYIDSSTGEVNSYYNEGWLVTFPVEGWFAYVRAENSFWYFDGTEWKKYSESFIPSPGSSTDNAIVRFDGTSGQLIQNSLATIDDTGKLVAVEIETPLTDTDKLEVGLMDAEFQLITVPTGSITLPAPTKLIIKVQSAVTEINSISSPTITGLNRLHILVNEQASGEILLNNSSGNIRTGTGDDLIMLPGSSVWLMYDDTLDIWRVVGGSGSGSSSGATPTVYLETASGSATFVMPIDPVVEENVEVYDGGVRQSTAHYSLSGVNLTLDYIPASGNEMMFVIGEAVSINVPANTSVSLPKLAADVLAFLIPTGTILPYGGVIAPTGFLLCAGASLDRTTYANLFAVIGTKFGTLSGSTFLAPNLRGVTLRGWDNGFGRDPDAASRVVLATGGNSGDNIGSYQVDAVQDHVHQYNVRPVVGNTVGGVAGSNGVSDGTNNINTSTMNSGNTSTETRMKNVYVNYIIKT